MKTIGSIILWAICLGIQAQSFRFSFQHIDRSRQLPDAAINCLIEKDHLLYIGTEEGLFGFNGGMVFKIPVEKEGERINVISLVKDPAGNLWIGTQNGLYIYTNREESIRIDNYKGTELNYLQTIACDISGNIWLLSGASDNTIFTYNMYSGRFKVYGKQYNTIRGYRQDASGMKELWFKTNNGVYNIHLEQGRARLKRYAPTNNGEDCQANDIYTDGGGNALVSTDKGLKIISPHDMQAYQDFFDSIYTRPLNAAAFYDNKVFLCTATEGLIITDLKQRKVISTFKKDPEDPGTLSSDAIRFCYISDRSLYVVSTENTIDYCGLTDNEFVYVRSPQKKGFRDIVEYQDELLLAGSDSMVYEMKDEQFFPHEKIRSPVLKLQLVENDLYTFTNQSITGYTRDSTHAYITNTPSITNIYGIAKNQGALLINTDGGVFKLFNGTTLPLEGLKDEIYKWYEHFLFLDENTLLVNAYYSYFLVVKKQGVVYNPIKLVHHIEKVNHVLKLNNKVLIAGDEGISLFDPATYEIRSLKKLPGQKFYRIIPAADPVFYTVSNKEISQCYLSGDRLIVMNTWNNIPTENIENHDMVLHNGVFYIPMKKGVLNFYPRQQQYGNFRLHINNIRVAGKFFKTHWKNDTIRSGYAQSETSMDVGLWSSHIHHATSIKYYLSKNDSGVVTSGRTSKIYFEKMNPGKHILTIQGVDANGKILAEEKIVFIISREWYQTVLFYIGSALLLLLFAYAIFRWRLKAENEKTKKQELMLRKIKESENLALRSQMNPHFIFNTLNSINNYVLNGDTENASTYLNKFSKLIRSTLDLTRTEKVTLAQEIHALKLYMDIEKARTHFKFDYEIHIDQHIEDDFIKLPPLIIQPFVENSIWHGIQGLEGRGKIEISILKEAENLITITVTDNGLGRDLLRQQKKTKISHGLNITGERLSIWHEKSRFEIIDLKDEKGQPAGTKVIIYLYYP